jgi:DHA1 family multidrug resistance protein-like MFS transporter
MTRNSYRGWVFRPRLAPAVLRFWRFLQSNRILAWACVVIAVNQLGFGIVVPVTPIYARTFGVSEAAVGLVVAVYGLGRFLFNLPAGQAADRFGRKPVIFAGTMVTCVGSVLCGLAPDFPQLLAFRFVGGVGAAIVITGVQVVVADVSTRETRGRMMATYMGFFTFAVGVGPSVGGLIASFAGPRAPFFAFAALATVAGMVALFVLPETKAARSMPSAEASVAPPLRGNARQLLTNVGFLTISLVTFVQFFNRTGAIFAVVPLMGVERLGLDAAMIGFALTAASLCNIALVGVTGQLVDRLGRKPVIVPGCLIAAAGFAGFALSTGYAMFVFSAILWGVSGAFISASAAYAADQAPPGANGVTMGVYRMLADLGYVVGPVLLGVIAMWSGADGALVFAAVLSVVTMLPFLLMAPETGGRKFVAKPAA